jgi:hypothetical protein
MDQETLKIPTKAGGPVECLGRMFPSDEARRAHYLKLLAEKLKDPEFRRIEGFPKGDDHTTASHLTRNSSTTANHSQRT